MQNSKKKKRKKKDHHQEVRLQIDVVMRRSTSSSSQTCWSARNSKKHATTAEAPKSTGGYGHDVTAVDSIAPPPQLHMPISGSYLELSSKTLEKIRLHENGRTSTAKIDHDHDSSSGSRLIHGDENDRNVTTIIVTSATGSNNSMPFRSEEEEEDCRRRRRPEDRENSCSDLKQSNVPKVVDAGAADYSSSLRSQHLFLRLSSTNGTVHDDECAIPSTSAEMAMANFFIQQPSSCRPICAPSLSRGHSARRVIDRSLLLPCPSISPSYRPSSASAVYDIIYNDCRMRSGGHEFEDDLVSMKARKSNSTAAAAADRFIITSEEEIRAAVAAEESIRDSRSSATVPVDNNEVELEIGVDREIDAAYAAASTIANVDRSRSHSTDDIDGISIPTSSKPDVLVCPAVDQTYTSIEQHMQHPMRNATISSSSTAAGACCSCRLEMEIEEFLSKAEQREQERFIVKYNFDPVNDVPLPAGRYEWHG